MDTHAKPALKSPISETAKDVTTSYKANIVLAGTSKQAASDVDGMDIVSSTTDEVSKHTLRQRVWRYLEKHHLSLFPRPAYNRIPNFKGAFDASRRLETLDTFINAKTVLVNTF